MTELDPQARGLFNRLAALPDKIDEILSVLSGHPPAPPPPELTAGIGICEDCVRLCNTVDQEVVGAMMGLVRELLIDVRSAVKSGNYAQASSMIDKVIEVASTDLKSVKERPNVDGNDCDPYIHRLKRHGKGKVNRGRKLNVNWKQLALNRGFPSAQVMLRDMGKRMSLTDVARAIGVDRAKVQSKWYSLGLHLE